LEFDLQDAAGVENLHLSVLEGDDHPVLGEALPGPQE